MEQASDEDLLGFSTHDTTHERFNQKYCKEKISWVHVWVSLSNSLLLVVSHNRPLPVLTYPYSKSKLPLVILLTSISKMSTTLFNALLLLLHPTTLHLVGSPRLMLKRILVPVHLGRIIRGRKTSLSLGLLLPVVALARAAAARERVTAIFSFRRGTCRESGVCGIWGEEGVGGKESVVCVVGFGCNVVVVSVACGKGFGVILVLCGVVCVDVNGRKFFTGRLSFYANSSRLSTSTAGAFCAMVLNPIAVKVLVCENLWVNFIGGILLTLGHLLSLVARRRERSELMQGYYNCFSVSALVWSLCIIFRAKYSGRLSDEASSRILGSLT
jgi:hypothetical protein